VTAKPPYDVELRGRYVTVRPQRLEDAPALFAALRDPVIWTWLSQPAPPDVAAMERIVAAALVERDAGTRWPWTVLADGIVAGTTSYGDIEPDHARIEIGWTAYGLAWQRTAVNTETKLLLLTHAFDDLGYERVALKTDRLNLRSQAAIERLGAEHEGVLRRHQRRADGTLRDTAYFSILREEWPAVRRRLVERLARR
jgi:RimJ/RimL family protein N-acetyltransferase